MKNYIKLVRSLCAVVACVVSLSACAQTYRCQTDPLPRTDTVVVLISVDKNKVPQVNKDKVTVYPGQRLVFVGPSEFILRHGEDFLFERDQKPSRSKKKEKKRTDGKAKVKSKNEGEDESEEISTDDGVINLTISNAYEDLLKDKDEIIVKYDVIVNGVPLDPFIKIVLH